MRKWTLLVIPQGQGNTSTLHVYGFQIWTVVLVLALLSFCSAFFFKRHQISQHEIQRLEQHALELQAAQSEPAPAGNGNGEASNPGLGEEELAEIKMAMAEESAERVRDEIGDLLFAVVNLTRFMGHEAEEVLDLTVKKFTRRFQYIEDQVHGGGRALTDCSLEELEEFWQQAKLQETQVSE